MKNLQYYCIREQIIKAIRVFFQRQNFHEVITQVLNDTIPLEPNIYPFEIEWKTLKGTKKLFLSTSPEKSLKKMLALGIGNCFSIGHSFRNLESAGPLHTPEFLMLEWYRKDADYKDIMVDVEQLLHYVLKKIKQSHFNVLKHYNRISLVDLFKKHCRLSLEEVAINDKKLYAYARKKKYQTKNATWQELYDQVFVNEIEPNIPKEPCFLIDFPSRISPLCKPKKKEPYLAERFELYINRIELANGNTENTDVESILELFKSEQANRKSQNARTSPIPPIDHDFLNTLKIMHNVSYAGVGLGLDRLATILSQ